MRPEDGKKIYDNIEIPEELSRVVNRAIASKDKERIMREAKKRQKRNMTVRIFRGAAAAAAGLLVCVTVGLNTSEAFAKEMSDIPVLGALAQVLTVRSYHGTDGDYEIDMEVPKIEEETASGAATDRTADVNAEIGKIVDDYMEQAKTEFQEYKEAFFATGGTEEEWADRKMDITVDYNIKYQKGNILSLELITAKGWVAAEEERHYYNLDLSDGQDLTLRQLLGDSYVEQCNESIKKQIEDRLAADDSLSYFGFGPNAQDDKESGIEGFTTVTEDTDFYINEKGEVVIVFPEYSIAPGYMGFQEFVVGTAQLLS
ncbi:MAG: DUF3298 domain-containing protein [Eubacteriales bacterium]|nr:DUF3298 domain-containing protein [Eubacteriales bacterium]